MEMDSPHFENGVKRGNLNVLNRNSYAVKYR